MKNFTISELLEENRRKKNILKLKIVAGQKGLSRNVKRIEHNRPGLALAGFFKRFGADRIQIFGRGESEYLKTLSKEKRDSFYSNFFSYKIPLCVFTHSTEPPLLFKNIAEKSNTPIGVSSLSTSCFILLLTQLLESKLANSSLIHGVLIEIFGVGILITGESGIGKSETALELVKRGHRLVSDDVVHLIKASGDILLGSPDPVIKHRVEIRGLGIVDIERIFGIGAVKNLEKIDLIVHLEEWSLNKHYDRLGLKTSFKNILGVSVPLIRIPVRAGRNIPVIIETAAMNKRLKDMGENAGSILTKEVRKDLKRKKGGKND